MNLLLIYVRHQPITDTSANYESFTNARIETHLPITNLYEYTNKTISKFVDEYVNS